MPCDSFYIKLLDWCYRVSSRTTTECQQGKCSNSQPEFSSAPWSVCQFVQSIRGRELEEKLSRNGTGVDAVAAEIKDSGKSNGNMQWLLVGVWVVFYFFMNNGGS